MNFIGQVPLKNPHTCASHNGPGSQWGKPYYHLGQECEKAGVPRGTLKDPLSLARTQMHQTRLNIPAREKTLHVFNDPPSACSCVVSYNKDGLTMDSQSHYTKIGSKHMCLPRPDHQHAMHRSMSEPSIHPWGKRRSQFRDPTPSYMNAAFSTTSDEVGKYYSAPMTKDHSKFPRNNYDWYGTKAKLR